MRSPPSADITREAEVRVAEFRRRLELAQGGSSPRKEDGTMEDGYRGDQVSASLGMWHSIWKKQGRWDLMSEKERVAVKFALGWEE